jgi:hypothetical protein
MEEKGGLYLAGRLPDAGRKVRRVQLFVCGDERAVHIDWHTKGEGKCCGQGGEITPTGHEVCMVCTRFARQFGMVVRTFMRLIFFPVMQLDEIQKREFRRSGSVLEEMLDQPGQFAEFCPERRRQEGGAAINQQKRYACFMHHFTKIQKTTKSD